MAPQSCCGSGTQLFETWDGQRSWPWTVPTLSLLRTVRCSVQIKEHWKGTCVEMEGKSGGLSLNGPLKLIPHVHPHMPLIAALLGSSAGCIILLGAYNSRLLTTDLIDGVDECTARILDKPHVRSICTCKGKKRDGKTRCW